MANKNWVKMPLKKLCTRIGDGLHGTPEYSPNTKIFFINGNNLKNGKIEITKDTKTVAESELSKNFIPLDKNTLLLSINGTLGSMAFYNNEKVMLGKSAAYLNFKNDINRFYYYYFQLNGVQNYFYNVATGSTIKNLSLKSIQDFEVPVPKEEEWNGIVNILSSIDAKIELNNKINQELEAMVKMLYDYWFVQFDFPNEQGKPYKSSGGKMVYNEKLKRLIPEWWKLGTIKDIADLHRGVSYSDKDIKCLNDNDTTPVLRATNIEGNMIDLNDMVYVPNTLIRLNQLVNKYDIIITMSSGSKQHIGKNGFYYFDEKVGFGAFCAKLVAKNNFRYFLYSYTQSDFMFATIKNECLGTNINNLNSSMVNGFKVVIPPSGLLDFFNIKVETFYKQIENNYMQNQKLTELRDWLLPMLMNGQVTVGEVEEELNIAAEPKERYEVI